MRSVEWAASVERSSVERSLPDPRLTFQSDIANIVMSLTPGLMLDFPGPGKLKAAAKVATAESEEKYFAFELSVPGLQGAQSGYVSGKVDFLNLLDAERTLLEFELSEVEARVQRELALAELSLLILGTPPTNAPKVVGQRWGTKRATARLFSV